MDLPEESVEGVEGAGRTDQKQQDAAAIAKPLDLTAVATPWYTGQKERLMLGTTTGSAEEVSVREPVVRFLEEHLWTWSSFQPILPPTAFKRTGMLIGAADPFDPAVGEDEKERISVDEAGKPKRLTPEQYKQVWDFGRFDVPSQNMPGEHYTWQLSYMLIFGFKNNTELLNDRLAVALAQVLVSSRLRLFSTRAGSIAHGVRHIGGGLVDAAAALIGLPEMCPKYSADFVERIAQSLEKQDLLRGGSIQQFRFTTASGDVADLRPFFKCGDSPAHTLSESVSRAWEEVVSAWAQDRFTFEEKLREQHKDQPASAALEVQIANELVEEETRLFYVALARQLTNDYDEAYASAVQFYFEARRLIAQMEADRAARIQAARTAAEADLKIRCPIRSRIPEWLEAQLQRAEPKVEPLLPEALFQMRQAKLRDSVVYLAHHVQYQHDRAAAVIKRLSEEEVPLGCISIGRRMWFKRNWKLIKQPRRDGLPPLYRAEKWHNISVATSHPFWRLQLFGVRIWVWWSNSLFFLGQNLLHGPLSLRALVCRAYRPEYDIDRQTGEMVVAPYEVETLRSRLEALWRQIKRSRLAFEATPDRGFLGKSVQRIFNVFWNYCLLGALGSLGIVTLQPVLTVANYALSIALGLTSIAWAPISVALHRMFQLFLYDTDHQRRGSAIMPLLAALNRFSTFGVLQIAGSLLAGLAVHPALSVVISAASAVASVTRAAYDGFMYFAAIKPRARVPAHDTFLCRMVHGPGVARAHWQHITAEEVLAGVQAALEREENDHYSALIYQAINQPARQRQLLMNSVFNPVGLAASAHPAFARSDRTIHAIMEKFKRAIADRQERFPTIQGGGNLKQSTAELRDTIDSVVTLVKGFYEERLFPMQEALQRQPVYLWQQKDLKRGDWQGLAKRYMSDAFGTELLESIEDTDQTFHLDVRHTDLREFVSMIKKARPHDPMQTVGGKPRAPREPARPTRVGAEPSWANDVISPEPRTHSDALSPAASRETTEQNPKPATLLDAILSFSEDRKLNPPPGPDDEVEVPRDQVPWLRNNN